MAEIPNNTAVRVALWRALHLQLDRAPHVLEDDVGLKLVAPDASWRDRPDMDPVRTRSSRASIVARSRFVEDLVAQRADQGVTQYVLLGAGLDTFAQRETALASRIDVFEVEQPQTQAWKRERLAQLGLPTPLHFVPVDFETKQSWLDELARAGFAKDKPAVVSSLGVAMYLTMEAITTMLAQVASLAAGSTFVMSFMLPIELMDPAMRPGIEAAARGARAAGTPFLSFFEPRKLLALATAAGFKGVQHVSSTQLAERYFANRSDGLTPAGGEELLIATT